MNDAIKRLIPVFFIGALISPTVLAEQTTPPGLLRATENPGNAPPLVNAVPGQEAFVRVNPGLLRAGKVYLDLPDGTRIEVLRERVVDQEKDKGKFVWVGKVEGEVDNLVIIARRGQVISGIVHYDNALYKINHVGNGVHRIAQFKRSEPYPEIFPIPVADTGGGGEPVTSETSADTGSVMDVLVVYTTAAKNYYATRGGIQALIDTAEAETNQAYQNSEIAAQIRVVGTVETSYMESNSMSTDLSRLRSTSDGYMDEVHGLRDLYGADMVTLIELGANYCGIAYRMTSLSASFASSAFSVVDHDCATGYYSFGHELGHNQGLHHDRDNASGSSIVRSYAYGHQVPNVNFRTVLAYNCSGGCTRRPYFSNPYVYYAGQPTGVDHDVDPASSADNALTLEEVKTTVANWRQSADTDPPDAPTALSATAASHSQIDLAWMDSSNNEAGFRIERSLDGSNWNEIAVVGTDVTAYQDSGLAASTQYWYRVLAYNGAGNSEYSNMAGDMTMDPPPYTVTYATGETFVAGRVSGDYTDTHEDDGVVQTVTERESGGKPSNRHSYLEHRWRFEVQPADLITLEANVTADRSGDGDSFVFEYSADGQNWTEAFVIDDSSSPNQSEMLPESLAGTLHVRVRDTDRMRTHRELDWVRVDSLQVFMHNEFPDADSDGVADLVDNCPDDGNPGQDNLDGDEFGDVCDDDVDDDGLDNGAGGGPDTDDDNDGLLNVNEASVGGDPFDPDTDDDGIYDGLDRDPDSASNHLCMPLDTEGTVNLPISNQMTCAATRTINVIPPAVVTSTGDLLLIAPDGIFIDDIESGLTPLVIEQGGKFEIIITAPNAPVLPP